MVFAKSRYAEARTDATAVRAAVLPGGVIQEPPKFRGERSALVGLLPFTRAGLKPEYRWLICQDGPQFFQDANWLCQRMDDHRSGHCGGWANEQGRKILLDPGQRPPVCLLRSAQPFVLTHFIARTGTHPG